MNTTARRFIPLTLPPLTLPLQTLLPLTVATLAALFMLPDRPTVVALEAVHVIGQRVPAATVVRAPLVEVTARRADERAWPVVQLPTVEVTARRAADATRVAQQRPVALPAAKPV